MLPSVEVGGWMSPRGVGRSGDGTMIFPNSERLRVYDCVPNELCELGCNLAVLSVILVQ